MDSEHDTKHQLDQGTKEVMAVSIIIWLTYWWRLRIFLPQHLFYPAPTLRSGKFLQNLAKYSTIMHDLRVAEQRVVQKRSELFAVERQLLVEEMECASQRAEDAGDDMDFIRTAVGIPTALRPVNLSPFANRIYAPTDSIFGEQVQLGRERMASLLQEQQTDGDGDEGVVPDSRREEAIATGKHWDLESSQYSISFLAAVLLSFSLQVEVKS